MFALVHQACDLRQTVISAILCLVAFNTVLLLLGDRAYVVAERGRRNGPESHAVRLCRHTECARMVWNRDVNAAINILDLALQYAYGLPKSQPFSRDVH